MVKTILITADNRSKRRRNEKMTKQDFTIFAERRENQRIHISPQLTLATFQYLSTGEWHQVRLGLTVFLQNSNQIFKYEGEPSPLVLTNHTQHKFLSV